MKKYLQIAIVLGIFALLVIVRQAKGDNQPVVVGGSQSNNLVSPQPQPSVASAGTPTPTQASSSSTVTPATQSPTPTVQVAQGQYKNGTFTGSVQDAFYGSVQVQLVISGGKITDVNILQYPNDNRTSQYINSQAMPMLKQEVLQAQSANISGVSGASASSPAFIASVTDALTQAKQ
jgi:uncharacterized protein with FMN-binding domain